MVSFQEVAFVRDDQNRERLFGQDYPVLGMRKQFSCVDKSCAVTLPLWPENCPGSLPLLTQTWPLLLPGCMSFPCMFPPPRIVGRQLSKMSSVDLKRPGLFTGTPPSYLNSEETICGDRVLSVPVHRQNSSLEMSV